MPDRRTIDEPGMLARLIFRLRNERRMSQTAVADAAGWGASGQKYLSQVENGKIGLPGEDKIAEIERALDLEPGAIEQQIYRRDRFMLADPPPPPNVVDFPDPRLRPVMERLKNMVAVDRSGRLLRRVEKLLIDVEEEFVEQQGIDDEDQSDSEPGANVPGM